MPADCCCALSCPVLVICLPHSRGSHPSTSPLATSCCSCDPTQKGDGEMGHSQHRLHWGKLDWTMLGLSPYRPISHVLLLNRIQKMKYHINMLTVQNKREFMIHFAPLTPSLMPGLRNPDDCRVSKGEVCCGVPAASPGPRPRSLIR